MARLTSDSGTVTRKPDDTVGSPGERPAGGGHQTAEQAAITDMEAGGAAKTEPKEGWGGSSQAGRAPPAFGGSSGGHSDQKASRGPQADQKVADGHYHVEQENKKMTEREDPKPKKPANIAPDAVKDPNEKTEGKPGLGPQGEKSQHDETDPGGS